VGTITVSVVEFNGAQSHSNPEVADFDSLMNRISSVAVLATGETGSDQKRQRTRY
jgi:hypothetical protein